MKTVVMTRVDDPHPSADARRVDRGAVRKAARSVQVAIAQDVLPCAVVGVADSRGILALETVPGVRTPKLRRNSIFFLASITKPIVATAFMRLVDAGEVDLHEPLQRWVPAFQGTGKEQVTAWHVLTHTSGIPDEDIELLRRERPTAARMLELVCKAPLRFDPGSRYEYCSSSFYLLAEVMSRILGRPFPDALRSQIMRPVGMFDTTFDPRYDRRRIVPVEGVPLRNRIVRELVLRFLARATLPGGGLWGTAEDLLRFGQALLPGATGSPTSLLSAAALEQMTTEQTAGILEISEDGATRDPRYALGWGKPHVEGRAPTVVGHGGQGAGVTTVPASARAFTHGGATGTRLWIDPERDLVFVFLTNVWGADDSAMFGTLAEVYRAFDA